MNNRQKQLKSFDRLLSIVDEFREKCPWDKKQTIESLRHLTIEEVYELGDAILDNNIEDIKKELGDVFYFIYFFMLKLIVKKTTLIYWMLTMLFVIN